MKPTIFMAWQLREKMQGKWTLEQIERKARQNKHLSRETADEQQHSQHNTQRPHAL